MDGGRLHDCEHGTKAVVFSSSEMKIQWSPHESSSHAFFASVSRLGIAIGISPNAQNPQLNGPKLLTTNSYMKYVSVPESGYWAGCWVPETMEEKAEGVGRVVKRSKMGLGLKLKIKIRNASLRRLISGAIAGAVSRSAVAPLETMRTHLMVGSCGDSITQVFHSIMETEGWKGLFRGNLVNVIRVAPSKAIEV